MNMSTAKKMQCMHLKSLNVNVKFSLTKKYCIMMKSFGKFIRHKVFILKQHYKIVTSIEVMRTLGRSSREHTL